MPRRSDHSGVADYVHQELSKAKHIPMTQDQEDSFVRIPFANGALYLKTDWATKSLQLELPSPRHPYDPTLILEPKEALRLSKQIQESAGEWV